MDNRIAWSAGSFAFCAGSVFAIFEVQQMTMPPIIFWVLVILLTLGAIGSFIVLVSILGHWFLNRGKALEFVGEWYCHYNRQAREVNVNGAVDLWSHTKTTLCQVYNP